MLNLKNNFQQQLLTADWDNSYQLSSLVCSLNSVKMEPTKLSEEKLLELANNRLQASKTLRHKSQASEQSIEKWLLTSYKFSQKDFLEFHDLLLINQSLGGTGELRENDIKAEARYVTHSKINEYIDVLSETIEKLNFQISQDTPQMTHHFLYTLAFFARTFSSVHPFSDANGRTLRIILDFYLDKAWLPPLTYNSPGEFYLSAFEGTNYFPSILEVADIIYRGINNSFKTLLTTEIKSEIT